MSTNPPGREAAERRSAVPLVYLRRMPPTVIPVLSAVLLVAGMVIQGPAGAAAIGLLLLFLGWLAYLSWPKLGYGGRALRVLILAGVVVLAVWLAAN
jgi:hypothetical protein